MVRDVFRNYWNVIDNNPEAPKGSYRYGMVPCVTNPDLPQMGFAQIPILAWGCLNIFNQTNDRELLDLCLPYLDAYLTWYATERDVDDDGLIEYGAYKKISIGDMVQTAKFETFDFHATLDDLKLIEHPTRGTGGEWYGNIEGVEQTCFLAISERAMVGDSATPQTITATNTGSAPLSISSIDSSNPEFSIGADTCSSQVLAAAAQCSFAVGFTPTSDGAQSASLQFISNAGTSPDKISAAGSGKRVSSETLSPSSLTFPTFVIGQPAITRQVLLTNTGSANLVVGSISSASPHYSVVDNLCSGMSIAPQTHCTFSVTFSPNAVGTWDSQIEIHTDIPSSPDLLPVTGTGVSSLIPPEPAVPVPAISKWALILLLMLFGLAVFTQRRNLL